MKKIFLVLMSVMFLTSCSDDDNGGNCLSFEDAYIDSVMQLETADAAGFVYRVNFTVNNSCGDFGSFGEILTDNTRTITLKARYDGCVCDEALANRDAIYTFNPTAPGTYTLKFRTSEDTFITETVTVE